MKECRTTNTENDMKKNTTNNILIGARVLIDWPCRWRGYDPKVMESCRALAEKEEMWFGETGVVVAHDPQDSAKDWMVCRDRDGQVHHFYHGALSVTQLPANDRDVVAVLKEILTEMRKYSPA
jgi:hypothetical protein